MVTVGSCNLQNGFVVVLFCRVQKEEVQCSATSLCGRNGGGRCVTTGDSPVERSGRCTTDVSIPEPKQTAKRTKEGEEIFPRWEQFSIAFLILVTPSPLRRFNKNMFVKFKSIQNATVDGVFALLNRSTRASRRVSFVNVTAMPFWQKELVPSLTDQTRARAPALNTLPD